MVVYIFLYNVIYIKSDFLKLYDPSKHKMILIGSKYCLSELSVKNRYCFEAVHEVSRDFHEINQQEVEKILQSYLIAYKPENIRLLTNEDSAQLTCARLREKYGIPGLHFDVLLPFVNKVASKERLGSAVKTHKFVAFKKKEYEKNKEEYINFIVGKLGFPMFAKPVDLVSSVETYFIADKHSLREMANNIACHEYEFEIDEFIQGELFHCDAMIVNKEIKFFMVGKCSFALARFFEGKPVGSIPINNKFLFNRLKKFCTKTFNRLECPDGAYHMEVFVTKSGEIIFLEIGARTGGALITRVYEKLFDINIEETNYRIQMGLNDDVPISQKNIFAGFLNFPKIKGEVTSIELPKLDIDHEVIKFAGPGDNLNTAKNLLDISCSIIFWDTSYQKVENTFEFLKNYKPLRLREALPQYQIAV